MKSRTAFREEVSRYCAGGVPESGRLRRMRRSAPFLLVTIAVVWLVAAMFRGGNAPKPTTSMTTADGSVVRTETSCYSTRPLRRDEVLEPLLPVALPRDATDVQFASYAEWQAFELFVAFRAPPATCEAYAREVLAAFNRANPNRRVAADLVPIAGAVDRIQSGTLAVGWFRPDAIGSGVEGGERGSHQPKVWVDAATGTFYYLYTD